MALLFPSHAIAKIKYYMTKGSQKVFCVFLTYLIIELKKDAYVLEVMVSTALVALPHMCTGMQEWKIWEHIDL